MKAIGSALWQIAKKEPCQNVINVTLGTGEEFQILRRLAGWNCKVELSTEGILLFEGHIVPRRGQTDADIMNAWDRISMRAQDWVYADVDGTRTSAYIKLEELINDQ